MSSPGYYDTQQVGQVYTPDHVPLLPVHHQTAPHQQQQHDYHHHQQYAHPSPQPSNAYSYAPIIAPAPSKPIFDHGKPTHQHHINQSQQRIKRSSRHLLALRTLSQSISTLFSAVMFAMMAFVLYTFYSTRDQVYGGQAAWPPNPKLWPTILLLAGALATLLVAVGTLIMYCSARGRAKGSWRLVLVQYGVHIVVWALITILYRYEKGQNNVNDDLWGWSCGDMAKKLQQDLDSDINFDMLCKVQAKSFIFSILETLVKILFVLVHVFMRRRILKREKVKLAHEVGDLATELAQNLF